MYKRKDWKVRPVNAPLSGGINPGGGVNIEGRLKEGETAAGQQYHVGLSWPWNGLNKYESVLD